MSRRLSLSRFFLVGGFVLLVAAIAALFLFAPASPPSPGSASSDAPPQASTTVAAASATPRSSAEWQAKIAGAEVSDFDDLMQTAMTISDPDLRTRTVAALAARWINADIRGFIAYVDRTEAAEEGDVSVWSILAPALIHALPSIDEQAATSPDLREIIQRLVQFHAATDPAAALAWARDWLMDDTLQSALATISVELAAESPEQALAVLDTITQPLRRIEAVAGIAAARAAADPDAALAWAKTLKAPAERPYAMQSVLATLAARDPQRASGEFGQYRDTLDREFDAQVRADREAMGLDSVSARNIEFAAPENLAAAEDGAAVPGRSPGVDILSRAAPEIVRFLAAGDPQNALAWAADLPAGRMKTAALSTALAVWAERDPAAAYARYQAAYADEPQPAGGIFEVWAAQDSATATEVALTMPDGPARESAVRGVVNGWAESGGPAGDVGAWVDTLPAGAARDAAAAEYVESLGHEEPVAAWERARSIGEPTARKSALKSALANAIIKDPSAARQLVERANFSTADRLYFTRMVDAVSVN